MLSRWFYTISVHTHWLALILLLSWLSESAQIVQFVSKYKSIKFGVKKSIDCINCGQDVLPIVSTLRKRVEIHHNNYFTRWLIVIKRNYKLTTWVPLCCFALNALKYSVIEFCKHQTRGSFRAIIFSLFISKQLLERLLVYFHC